MSDMRAELSAFPASRLIPDMGSAWSCTESQRAALDGDNNGTSLEDLVHSVTQTHLCLLSRVPQLNVKKEELMRHILQFNPSRQRTLSRLTHVGVVAGLDGVVAL